MFNLSLVILTLLMSATLFVNVRLKINFSSELIVNRKRINTWWLIVIITISVLYAGDWALLGLLYVLIFWAMFEVLRLPGIVVGIAQIILLTAVVFSYSYFIGHQSQLAGLGFILPVIILISSLAFYSSKKIYSILILLFCVVSILSIQLVSQLSHQQGYNSGLIILFLFFMTAINDIAQYIFGKLFGRTPLSPLISPDKTIEGAIGGVVTTGLLMSFTLPYIIDINWTKACLVGVFISFLGIVGNLNFSFLKRLFEVKDTGASMPGHGGLLDRIDSLTLTAPGFGFCLYLVS